MKSLFTGITALSLRFRWITLTVAVLLSAAGVVAVSQLRQELIPAVEFPQTIILSQASGMTSEQVLAVLTQRLEAAIDSVPEVANIESTTTGSFGAVITARNDFGLNQERIRASIVAAIDQIWLPLRAIQPPAGEDPRAFAQRLLADLPADVLIWLEERDASFLFQLAPDVWSALSPETTRTLLGYLASRDQETASESALQLLVDREIAPALENLPQIASVQTSGGQALPDASGVIPTPPPVTAEPVSMLLQISGDAWAVASARAGYSGPLDQTAVEALAAEIAAPQAPPALPESWQMDHFATAADLREMRTLTRTPGAVLNAFLDTGIIRGALGQTNDLTPETIAQMLAIDPAMADYFSAEQLASMPPEVFAALPADYIAGLDGFTRDALAARALAASITGEQVQPPPVDLPAPWRISPPQLITFSFDDLPLASFSISGDTGAAQAVQTDADPAAQPVNDDSTAATDAPAARIDVPEGPGLPFTFNLLGGFIGVELNTADDLITLQLPETLAAQFGGSELSAAQLLNFLMLLRDPSALPEGVQAPTLPIDPAALIGALSPDAVAFIAENDPTFVPALSPEVFDSFSDGVLSLPQIAPPLDQVWNTLASQPQFSQSPLRSAADLVRLGSGRPSDVLNTIDASIPAEFAGYEVRLFNSLTPAELRYFSLQQSGFYSALSADVLLKLSPAALAALPADALAALPADAQTQVQAIASGSASSAAAALAERYATDAPPADPDAPALNSDWQFIGDFIGIELNSADDFFRFLPDPTGFWNSLFDSAQGASFATRLFSGLPADAAVYIDQRDPSIFLNVRIEALQLLSAETLAALPQPVQDRARSGAAPFSPTAPVTRTNGEASLILTVYKSDGANTVEAFHAAEDMVREITASHPEIKVAIAFEQASFIEESISGVAREGGLGAVFAVVVILVFLSNGHWAAARRRLTGAVLMALFLVALAAVVLMNAGAAGGDLGAAWDSADVLVRGMLLLGIASAALILLWPSSMPRPAWRSTLVTAVSIPLSVLMALAFMRWLPPAVHDALAPAAEGSGILTFILRLFPASLTINIMTLSGLTVAIGRVVDDSIVVLENIFRQVQEGGDKQTAILHGVRDVSVAIFAATVITVVVFLPLGLTGGIIGEFFLPFGLAVTYSLLASFIVAITVVPVLAYLLLDQKEVAAENHEGRLERLYLPALRWSLSKPSHRAIVLAVAFLSLVAGAVLFGTRPQAFLPSFGEPQISVSVNMPPGTSIVDNNALVEQLESYLSESIPEGEISRVQTIVGSAGLNLQSLLVGGSGVSENQSSITIAIEDQSQLDALTAQIRTEAVRIFGEDSVTVSASSLTEQGFGGFALVLSGAQEDLAAANPRVIETLSTVPGLTNVSSNLSGFTEGNADAPPTFIRIDSQPAVRYTAELETQNTLGVTSAAKAAVLAMPDLPESITVSEGFETQLQTQGFANLFVAMGIAISIVVLLLMLTFRSVIHWLDIILSIIVAPVGAAVALTLTDRVLGISAMIGLLMLIGIVVTNAVVLIDRVLSNIRERQMPITDALIEAGGRRLRPILMTAIATVMALMPLAIGLSKGAIIASELGTVVIGGLVSSTLLTLLVVPVAFTLLEPLNQRIGRLFRRSRQPTSGG